MNYILDKLFTMQDLKYKEFNRTIVANDMPMIGVRTPQLRRFAKELYNTELGNDFINQLPHTYFEEYNLHGFIISLNKDFNKCINDLELFLPYVNNWATCDQTNPVCFKTVDKSQLFAQALKWIDSDFVYEKRFGVKCLMDYFLKDSFDPKHLEIVSTIESEEYYINMVVAWYFATALAFQYDTTVIYIEKHLLNKFVEKKTIQKAIESFRISKEHKEYLRSLRT